VVDGFEIYDQLEIFIYWMKFHSKMCFLAIFNNKCIILFYFQEKPLIYERGEDFINGH
jgi:hypothetical protein